MPLEPMQKHALRDLDEMSIENLALGRITRTAMCEAVWRVRKHPAFAIGELGSLHKWSSYSDMILADALNEMLEGAREWKKGKE